MPPSTGKTSISRIPTPNASRYLQQLCRHWAHKFDARFDNAEGSVDFGEGKSLHLQADETTLTLRIATQDQPAREKMEKVVAEHLLRFSFKEELALSWQPQQ